jgi:Immunity protein 50
VEAPTFVSNYQALLDHFGYWPSFHDANVISYAGPTAERQTVDLVLHAWETTSEVDPQGYYIMQKNVLVTFRFAGVHSARLERFDSGNILFGMSITRSGDADSFHVELDSVMDMSGDFSASSGEIASVVPCTSDGKAI